jgi:hypothetical protein
MTWIFHAIPWPARVIAAKRTCHYKNMAIIPPILKLSRRRNGAQLKPRAKQKASTAKEPAQNHADGQ